MLPVLFIHPDPVFAKLYHSHFSPHFAFDSAHDGLSAVRKIRTNAPKLIVSEYKLPRLSGLAVLKFLRSHPELHATPFIFLSDHPGVEEALGLGANGWFSPQSVNPPELLEHAIKTLRAQYHSSIFR